MMPFNPNEHLTDLKGKKYLEAKWRLMWFRDDHPHGKVSTEMISADPLIFRATVLTAEGELLASGHGSAVAKQGAVWNGREVEKAETAAISRALGHAGYGTQFTEDDDVNHLADSPVHKTQTVAPKPTASPASTPPTGSASGDSDKFTQSFPATQRATPDALYSETRAYFNDPKHFDAFWDKHAGMLDNLTLEEAVRYVVQAHWNWDKEAIARLGRIAADNYGIGTGGELLEALTAANGHSVKKWRDWDGGNFTVAQGALLAWHSGFVSAHAREIGKEKGVSDGVIYSAQEICANYVREHAEPEAANG